MKHKCLHCGYLCIETRTFNGESAKYPELSNKDRMKNFDVFYAGQRLFCYRREVVFEIESELIRSGDVIAQNELVNKLRICRYFIKHVSGYNPAQHLTRWESIEREKATIRWNILFLFLGAILTIIGGVIAQVVMSKP